MKLSAKHILASAIAILALSACSQTDKKADATLDPLVEKRVDHLLSQMTLEEKVGQMAQLAVDVITVGPNAYSTDEPVTIDTAKAREAILKYHVGSILNTANGRARTLEEWNRMITDIQNIAVKESRLGIPILYGVDAIHGATYTANAVMFPQQIAIAATWNTAIAEQGAAISAYETRASGIPWTFAPVLDMGINACWPRQWETFGEDIHLTTQMGLATIRGFEGNNVADSCHVASCLKHFMGYSAATSGKDRTTAYIPESQLREVHLPAFAAAIKAGAKSVMINSGTINGLPVHANHRIITEILKDELHFNGVVVTDWADINNICNRDHVAADIKTAIKMAINAGIDISMIPYETDFCTMLVELVNNGEVPMARIDDAVRRILRLKVELGLFERPVTLAADYPAFASKEHKSAAFVAACEAMTLLKNDGAILPLKPSTKVLVAGPNANSMRTLNGGWSYSWQGNLADQYADDSNTILEAVENRIGKANVTYVPGVEYDMNGKYYQECNIDINKAVAAARKADVVILCLGENSYTEKPGDLLDLNISSNQQELAIALAATGKPVVLVLNEGRQRLITSFASQMKAILMAYLPGNEGGDAIAATIFGDVNPSGKLPFSYPMYANSLVTYNHKPSESQEKMTGAYDYEGAVNLLYPLGFGLSYTTFEYSDLAINKTGLQANDTLIVNVTVKNTGNVEGKEVVQIFYSDLVASLTPDVRRLCAFDKISLLPGKSQTVSFRLPVSTFSFVGADNARICEAGDFEIACANLRTTFKLTTDVRF